MGMILIIITISINFCIHCISTIRCFVTYANGQWNCHFSECAVATAGRLRSGSDTCQTNSTCKHIKDAQLSQYSREQATCICLSSTVLKNTPLPPTVRSVPNRRSQPSHSTCFKEKLRCSNICYIRVTTWFTSCSYWPQQQSSMHLPYVQKSN